MLLLLLLLLLMLLLLLHIDLVVALCLLLLLLWILLRSSFLLPLSLFILSLSSLGALLDLNVSLCGTSILLSNLGAVMCVATGIAVICNLRPKCGPQGTSWTTSKPLIYCSQSQEQKPKSIKRPPLLPLAQVWSASLGKTILASNLRSQPDCSSSAGVALRSPSAIQGMAKAFVICMMVVIFLSLLPLKPVEQSR